MGISPQPAAMSRSSSRIRCVLPFFLTTLHLHSPPLQLLDHGLGRSLVQPGVDVSVPYWASSSHRPAAVGVAVGGEDTLPLHVTVSTALAHSRAVVHSLDLIRSDSVILSKLMARSVHVVLSAALARSNHVVLSNSMARSRLVVLSLILACSAGLALSPLMTRSSPLVLSYCVARSNQLVLTDDLAPTPAAAADPHARDVLSHTASAATLRIHSRTQPNANDSETT